MPKKKEIIAYALLPEIIPRIKSLLTFSFCTLAYLITYIFNAIRIIPDHHSYLNPSNLGKYGIGSALALAANNIKIDRKVSIEEVTVAEEKVVFKLPKELS